jgi:hypothetical protein
LPSPSKAAPSLFPSPILFIVLPPFPKLLNYFIVAIAKGANPDPSKTVVRALVAELGTVTVNYVEQSTGARSVKYVPGKGRRGKRGLEEGLRILEVPNFQESGWGRQQRIS